MKQLQVFKIALVAFMTLAGGQMAASQSTFPNRTVNIHVGFAPGGTTDLLARVVARKLQDMWGVSVVVNNRAGADGIIATTYVHQAQPDGHDLLMSTNALVITPHLRKLPYDPIADFEPITIVGREYHHFMVANSLSVKTVDEFIAYSKKNPGNVSFSSAGSGSAPYLGMERFRRAAGLAPMIHVPFSGTMPAVMALVNGDVQAMFASPSTTLNLVRDGRLRLVAVAGPKRDPNAPEAPTIVESGLKGFESDTWFALLASSKVPPPTLKKIRTDIAQVLRDPEIIKQVSAIGSVLVNNSADEFREIIKKELVMFGEIIGASQEKEPVK